MKTIKLNYFVVGSQIGDTSRLSPVANVATREMADALVKELSASTHWPHGCYEVNETVVICESRDEVTL